jgi:hypothetical protein
MHVQRTSERWRPVNNWEGIYEVSDAGRVRRCQPQRIMAGQVNTKGYRQVNMRHLGRRRVQLVHRLVADAFMGRPLTSSHQINHKDGDKLNNAASNLEWVTPSENQKHAYQLGLKSVTGERNPNAKLARKDVDRIRASSDSHVAAAAKYGVTPTLISMIRKHKIWR